MKALSWMEHHKECARWTGSGLEWHPPVNVRTWQPRKKTPTQVHMQLHAAAHYDTFCYFHTQYYSG